MRSINKFVCLLFCLLLGTIQLGESLKCFSCSSAHSHLCGDYFNRRIFSAYECPGSCVKTRGRDSNLNLEINRFCGAAGDDACYSDFYNDMSVDKCLCNTDFCNPASKSLPTHQVLIISLFSFLLVSCLLF